MGTLIFLALIFGLPAMAAYIHDSEYRKRQPEAAPYMFGYFVAYALFGFAFYLCWLAGGISSNPGVTVVQILLFLVIFGTPALYALNRKRWSFWLALALTFNPILWIVGAVLYGSKANPWAHS